MNIERAGVLVLVGGGALLAFIAWRKVAADGVAATAGAAGSAAVDAAGGFVGGAVQAVGTAVGIPRTDASACDRAIAAGDLWRASFDCPAATFLGAIGSRVTGEEAYGVTANGQGAALADAAEAAGYGEDENVNARDAMLARRAQPAMPGETGANTGSGFGGVIPWGW